MPAQTKTPNGGTGGTPSTKESLYATPLRKSDRPKGTTSVSSKGGDGKAAKLNGTEKRDSKVNNTNQSSKSRRSVEKGQNACIPNQDPILEQRRMRNFLKDQAAPVTPSHKKVDPASQINSNFSALAQEEHFANLVHQNVLNNLDNKEEEETASILDTTSESVGRETDLTNPDEETVNPAEETMTLEELEEKCLKNLELLTKKAAERESQETAASRDEEADLIMLRTSRVEIPPERMFIKREWALKKILICLEQRTSNKRGGPGGDFPLEVSSSAAGAHLHQQANNNLPQLGALVLGSNGSGKTTICQSILDGGNGTKGILNRRLLCCYLISSQNPECHSISIFIRSLVLQILSHSSYLFRDEDKVTATVTVGEISPKEFKPGEGEEKCDEGKSEEAAGRSVSNGKEPCSVAEASSESNTESKLSRLTSEKIKELEEMLISELQLSGHGSPIMAKKNIVRQQSEPVSKAELDGRKEFGSNPLLSCKEKDDLKKLQSPMKKISKIPVKIGSCRSSPKLSVGNEDVDEEKDDPEEGAAKAKDVDAEETSEADTCSAPEADRKLASEQPADQKNEVSGQQEDVVVTATETEDDQKEESISIAAPPPLPKTKDCRTVIADSYYELLMSNPDIMESLSVDCIEKNPDECFKKVILFPLLELNPPKSSLLFLIDSIDEHYITESSLISTLKKNSRGSIGAAPAASNKSQNIAELLAQHVHLLPKWLFLVCTGKKQNKHITKLFSGFKKITIDDLRKSHVVKDVQEYIILRLNTDFRNAINLTKDVIDSLNQLYLKSNGCILYLQKVMNGIKESFFTFREIRMLPCSLNGLYLYICQKSFNKKQFHKIRPILNILLAVPQAFVDKTFVFNCLRTQNYTIDMDEFQKRLEVMQNILVFDKDGEKLRIFHNSFADWLIDVKFSTKKFLCDVNEGHVMIAMYYALISEQLCPNMVRRFIYHLIKAGEYLQGKNQPLDLIVFLLETRANLSDCFYTNSLSCCKSCELDAKGELNLNLPRTRQMLSNYIDKALKNDQLQEFLSDFFKPNLPTDGKSLKLLIETGINNADPQVRKFILVLYWIFLSHLLISTFHPRVPYVQFFRLPIYNLLLKPHSSIETESISAKR